MMRARGFTIVELMLTVVILAIVSLLAIPSFERMILENRISSQTNELSSLISFARSEAVKRPGIFVTLCPTSDNASCSASNSWENGWIVMSDADGDRNLDSADGDAVLRVVPQLSGGNSLRLFGFGGNQFIQFSSNGQPAPAGALGATDGTLVICDKRGVTSARGVVVMVSGQTRLARDENGDGVINRHGGGANVSCP